MRGFFGEAEQTAWDIRFSVGNIPVRVTPWFWVGSVVLGYTSLKLGLEFLLAWVLLVFASILVHELGHAWAIRRLGAQPEIVLYLFGGLAGWRSYAPISRWQQIGVSLAGPAAGLLLFAVVKVCEFPMRHQLTQHPEWIWGSLVDFVIIQLIWVNFVWTLVNLLPVLPMDGGRVSEQLCLMLNPRRGQAIACWLGFFTAAAIAIFALQIQQPYMAILLGSFALQNFQLAQAAGRR